MRGKTWKTLSSRLALAACVAFLGGCSSGGGGSNAGAPSSPPGDNTGGTPPPPPPAPVLGAPAAPGYGDHSLLPETATTEDRTPTFTGISPTRFATGLFPALQSALTTSSSGIVGASTANTVTFSVQDTGPANCAFTRSCTTKFKLDLPSAKLSITGSIPSTLTDDTTTNLLQELGAVLSLRTAGLDYLTYGTWAYPWSTTTMITDAGSFVAGYQTPAAAMPKTGQAHYVGYQYGATGRVFVVSSGKVISASLMGNPILDVDFGNGTVSGGIRHIITVPDATPSAMPSEGFHDILISASIVGGTNTFNGTTSSANSNIGNPFTLKDTATGQIVGAFYGPTPTQIGAVWTLSNGDGTGIAVGALGSMYSGSGPVH